jgi:hypothetical protein
MIEVMSALITAGKAGNTKPWDGTGRDLPPDTNKSLLGFLGLPDPNKARADTARFLANSIQSSFDPPDVAGTVQLFSRTTVLAVQTLPMMPNDYAPSWNPPGAFTHVALDDGTSLRVHLVDKDVGSRFGFDTDDEIGFVDLNANDLRSALAQNTIQQVPVHQQGHQILFVGIRVRRE